MQGLEDACTGGFRRRGSLIRDGREVKEKEGTDSGVGLGLEDNLSR
jgi:hypothetical protein